MTRRLSRRLAATLSLTALALSLTQVATAAPPTPVETPVLELPAGFGCQFPLTVSATDGMVREVKFLDEDGNEVRVISVGTGISYTYTNVTTGESVTTKASGSAKSTVTNPDGTVTVTATGHNGLIMFPGDIPAGPTTTVYQGRIVYTIDAYGVWTLLTTSGKSRDICAELA